ncbi:putative nucleolin-like isoform X1 [Capsicum annuum]|nr:putative nucleolin-like isoform X1 [Capsicum annuum]
MEVERSFQDLLQKQEGDRALWEYPFAVAGVNITFMLIQMLDIGARNESAFDLLYCITFKLMDQQWLAMHASYMDFNTDVILKRTFPEIIYVNQVPYSSDVRSVTFDADSYEVHSNEQEEKLIQDSIMMKLVEYKNGVTWIEEEAQKINVIEDLQFVVIGKFSYGCPELEDLRIQISKQCKKVKIQYDIMPKCYHTCKLSHEESEYKSLHPELRLPREEEKLNGELNKNAEQDAPPV